MSEVHAAIGVDPGPIPGLVLIRWEESAHPLIDVVQCTHTVAPAVLRTLLDLVPADAEVAVGVERFVVGRRASRSSTSKAGEITRDLIGQLVLAVGERGALGLWHLRAAGEVKPWATDERLDAAGLLDATKGMRHARDAARHALFTAVRDCGKPDPLSKKAVNAAGGES